MSSSDMFWLSLAICFTACCLADRALVAWRDHQRTKRTKRIAAHGWPPSHIDADGDAIKYEDAERVTVD